MGALNVARPFVPTTLDPCLSLLTLLSHLQRLANGLQTAASWDWLLLTYAFLQSIEKVRPSEPFT